MAYDDDYFEIYTSIQKLGLKNEFDEELKNLRDQPEWKYREFKDKYNHAYSKVIKKYKERG